MTPIAATVVGGYGCGGCRQRRTPFINSGHLAITSRVPSGTYYVRVSGVNSVGVGLPSNPITVVVP